MLNPRKNNFNILLNTLYWIAGLILIILIWTILALTVFKKDNQLPDPIKCIQGAFDILGSARSWNAIWITFGQTLASYFGSFIMAITFVVLGLVWKPMQYIFSPFVTLGRALPTAILTVLLIAFCPSALIPIVVSFFIIFPMTYESLNSAVRNIDKNKIEMANVFNVSKKDQILSLYIPSIIPYMFSSLVAGFGLCFKVVLASQVIAGKHEYDSIGWEIIQASNPQNPHYSILVGWAIIAIFTSLFWELIIKEIGRLCMPSKFNDLRNLKRLFSIGAKNA